MQSAPPKAATVVKSTLKPRNPIEREPAAATTDLAATVCFSCTYEIKQAQTTQECSSCNNKCHKSCVAGKDLTCTACRTAKIPTCCFVCQSELDSEGTNKCLCCHKRVCSVACFAFHNPNQTDTNGFCEDCTETQKETMKVILHLLLGKFTQKSHIILTHIVFSIAPPALQARLTLTGNSYRIFYYCFSLTLSFQ